MPEPDKLKMIAELKEEYSELAEPEQFGVVVSVFVLEWRGGNVYLSGKNLSNLCTVVLDKIWSPCTLMLSFLFLCSPSKPTTNLVTLCVFHIACVLKNWNII